MESIHSRQFLGVFVEPYRLDTKWTLGRRQKFDSGFGVKWRRLDSKWDSFRVATIRTQGRKLSNVDPLGRSITLIPSASWQWTTKAKRLWRCFVRRRSF